MNHSQNEMWNDARSNCVILASGLLPMTTSKDEYPAMGVATMFEAISAEIYEVMEIPMNFCYPN